MTQTTPDSSKYVILNLDLNFDKLYQSVESLIVTLSECENVSTDLKRISLGNIDFTDSLAAKTYFFGIKSRFLELTTEIEDRKLFSISNATSELTCSNSNRIVYKDLASETTLTFAISLFSEVTIQEKNGEKILIPDSQKPKVFDALKVSENIKDMLLTVHTAQDKLTKLKELEDNSTIDPRIQITDDIVQRIKDIQKKSEPKPKDFSLK